MGMFKRLFSRSADSMKGARLCIDAAQGVVQDYRIYLESCAPLPGCVADESKLPHDKAVIKQAIRECMLVFRDPGLTEHLKHGYLMLSAWQKRVGEKTLGVDFTQLDLDADPLELAQQIQQQSESVEQWQDVIKAEQASMLSELEAIGV